MGRARLLALIGAVVLVACKQTTLEDHPCPPGGTTLTYDNFGKAFIDTNCQRCHGGSTGYRDGAPSGYDFATLDAVRHWKSRIFVRAAADNTTMPPGPDDPPLSEREKLADWLGCGAP